MAITAEHREMLTGSAITDEVLAASGIESYTGPNGSGVRFPWSDGVSATVWQARPDSPRLDDDGKPMKYLFPRGAKVPFNRLRDGDGCARLIIAEGTKQSYAVASHAPADMAVYGMSGCWGWKNADLAVAEGRDVFLLLDADLETNRDVWGATEQFTRMLKRHGAKSVRYVFTTGTGKDGVDDVLAAMPEGRRAESLKMWLAQAADRMPKRPAAKKTAAQEDELRFFQKVSGNLRFMPKDAAEHLLKEQPAALTKELNVALYRDGVYQIDGNAFLASTYRMLGNMFTPAYSSTLEQALIGHLYGNGQVLPERATAPLLNCPNGMVDLRTGELLDHDPKYMSSVQVAADYEPATPTPRYDAWLREAMRQEGHTDADVEALVADIEETAGTMLDPTRTPSKALFLFGPSRSGKSTFLRLLKAVAGAANTSAVTLHNLSTDQFAAANLYGRMLNVAADLSNRHVEDLSTFKMITGEDVIQANRKYGQQFEFTNQALVAFSANELPTVSEASRAYAERMKPFEFPNSFAGREDKTLEAKLMDELPGILARWVKAYGRFLSRGGYRQTDAATRTQFEAKSDRVVQFFQDMCTLTEASYGTKLAEHECTGRRDVAIKFNEWAERNGGSKMGERAFFQRLSQVAGVTEVKQGAKQRRAFNVVVAKADDDDWNESDEPVADPIEPSGVVDDIPRLGAGNPWDAAEAPSAPCPVPAATDKLNAPQTDVQPPATDPFAVGFELGYDL